MPVQLRDFLLRVKVSQKEEATMRGMQTPVTSKLLMVGTAWKNFRPSIKL